MANYADTLAAFDAAQAELAATATADLLTTAYSLTHRMDRAADRAGDVTRHRAVRAASREQHRNLRAQRDLITAELVRRGDGDR